jgi:hypothetical protein
MGSQESCISKSLARGTLDQGEHEKIRKALLAYSEQGMLALVRLVERLWLVSS